MIQRDGAGTREPEQSLRENIANLCDYQQNLNSDLDLLRGRLFEEHPSGPSGDKVPLGKAPPQPVLSGIQAAHRLTEIAGEIVHEILNRL